MRRNLGYRDAYTWDRRWCLQGDSIASILMRLARANLFSAKMLKQLFGHSAYLAEEGGDFATPRAGLVDWSRLATVLKLDSQFVLESRLVHLHEALSWAQICSRRFRYCPQCLAFGHHSRFFQIAALECCPLHGDPLKELCPYCARPTANYGLCKQLFGQPYCCAACRSALAGRIPTIKDYSTAPEMEVLLVPLWAALEKWIATIGDLNVSFAYLRDWKQDCHYESATVRAIDSLHIVGSIHPLPKQYRWHPPTVRRKALRLLVDDTKTRRVNLDSGAAVSRYLATRKYIESRHLQTPSVELAQRCHDLGWYVLDVNRNPSLAGRDAAYILWRMHCENFDDPALLKGAENRTTVSISDEMLPCAHWNLSAPAWATVYRGLFRGLVIDVEECMTHRMPIADLFRHSPSRQCCILPSIDLQRRASGYVVYPVLE